MKRQPVVLHSLHQADLPPRRRHGRLAGIALGVVLLAAIDYCTFVDQARAEAAARHRPPPARGGWTTVALGDGALDVVIAPVWLLAR